MPRLLGVVDYRFVAPWDVVASDEVQEAAVAENMASYLEAGTKAADPRDRAACEERKRTELRTVCVRRKVAYVEVP